MTAIPFPLTNSPGKTPQEGSGRLVNCYAEPLGEAGVKIGKQKYAAVWRRSAGLSRFKSTLNSSYRGGILVGSTVYAGWDGTVKSYLSTGAETSVGSLAGTSKLIWAHNNRPTPDIVAVDPYNGAYTITAGSVTNFADPDLPQPNSVCFQDGYFFFTIGDGRVFSSDLNAVTVNALNFAKAESKPDSALRAIPWNGVLFIFGDTSTEVWYDAANATGFPYSRSTVIQRGLAGRYAIAGHEDGFGAGLLWVADDRTVVKLAGYEAVKISPPDLDRLIASVTNMETLEASVYTEGGHSFWVLSSDDWTWEINLTTLKWNERKSYGLDRWRATQSLFAFNKWIYGDTQSGDLLYADGSVYTENGNPVVYDLESGPVQDFPFRQAVARADFDFSPGTGLATGTDPIQTNPHVEVSFSRDGGSNWSIPRLREIGSQGESTQRVRVTRAGLSGIQGHRWRLTVADPVYVGFMGGDQKAQLRA